MLHFGRSVNESFRVRHYGLFLLGMLDELKRRLKINTKVLLLVIKFLQISGANEYKATFVMFVLEFGQ